MINPPLVKELTRVPLIGTFFQLKHLMPLRLGLSVRNMVSPKLGYGGESDKYPTALRLGASYNLPSNWLLKNSQITLVSDFEWLYDDMDRLIHLDRRVEVHEIAPGAGQYFGTEFQYRTANLHLSPRFGLSHVYDNWNVSTGLGLVYKTSNLDFQFDFAHGFHEDLADDQRVSLTIRFGGKRDAEYYVGTGGITTTGQTDTRPFLDPCLSAITETPDDAVTPGDTVIYSNTSLSQLSTILRVLSGYPAQLEEVIPAAMILAGELDRSNADRYIELVGGPLLAVNLTEKRLLLPSKPVNVERRVVLP